ncbi:MAG: LmbU family transcriptional regulator [Solirubrobacterales bacterium]
MELTQEAWLIAGRRLGSIGRGSQWWVADWMLYGSSRWGEKYVLAAKITGYDSQTLRNMAYVARSVELSRRRDNLSWSHHAEVSALDPDEQDEWLELASRERMSVSDLRVALRTARREDRSVSGDPQPPEPRASQVTCPHCHQQFDIPLDLD